MPRNRPQAPVGANSFATVVLVAAVALVGSVCALAADTENLIANPSFENLDAEGLPTSWILREWRGVPQVGARAITKGAHSGKRALQLTAETHPVTYGAYCWPVELGDEPDRSLLLSFWYRTAGEPAARVALALFTGEFAESEWDTPRLQEEIRPLPDSRKWRRECLVVKPLRGARQAVLLFQVSEAGSLYLDTVAMLSHPGPISGELTAAGELAKLPRGRQCGWKIRSSAKQETEVLAEALVYTDQDRKPKQLRKSVRLSARGAAEVTFDYEAPSDAPHRLEMLLSDPEQTITHAYRRLDVPPLVDARIEAPAFRQTITARDQGDPVEVRGRLNATKALWEGIEIVASLHGAGRGGEGTTAHVRNLRTPEFSVSLDPGKLLAGAYEVRLEAQMDGKVVSATTLHLTRTGREGPEVGYDRDLTLRCEDEPFFPVMLAGIMAPEELELAQQAGFNSVLVATAQCSTALMDEAARRGLRVLAQSNSNEERFWRHFTGKFADSHQLLGYHLVDLPEAGLVPPRLIAPIYDALCSLDPSRPVMGSIGARGSYARYAPHMDILVVDPRPVPLAPLASIGECVADGTAAVRGHKPVWVVVQSIGPHWTVSRALDKAGSGRAPMPAEHRCLAFLGLVHGAKGLVFRDFRAVGGRGLPSFSIRRDAPRLWESVPGTNARIEALRPALLEGVPSAEPLVTGQGLHVRLWRHPDALYAVAVNAEREFVEGLIDLPVRRDAEVQVLEEGRTLTAKGGSVIDDFRPYDVHIYRVAGAAVTAAE